MFKAYVMRDGMWVKVYELHGWYDAVCWTLAIGLVTTIGICVARNV